MTSLAPLAYKNGLLHIEDLPLSALAEKFGSPAYIYSASRIIGNYRAYEAAFKKVMPRDRFTICYACKANSNIAVLRLLASEGAGADIVSGGELARTLKAGIPAKKTVFSGVGKSAEEIDTAIKKGLFQINVESEAELRLISAAAVRQGRKVHIAFRVNPDVDAKTHAKITTGTKENKFGIDLDRAPALYRLAARLPGIVADGVAVHIGSQLTSLAPFKKAYQRIAALVKILRAEGHAITRVDIGGGIGIAYRDETPLDLYLYALMVRDVIGPLGVHIIMEPGRSIVGDAGILLSAVRHIKQGSHKKFLILDAAMNDLIRPALYDAYHAILPVKKARPAESYDIVGPVCETGDTFLTRQKMPKMAAGDLVSIMAAGAYGAVMSCNYNTRPLLPEILVQGSRMAVIRPRQTIEDLLRPEKIPDWLK